MEKVLKGFLIFLVITFISMLWLALFLHIKSQIDDLVKRNVYEEQTTSKHYGLDTSKKEITLTTGVNK